MSAPNPDIRWLQRFDNYQKAVANLAEVLELAATGERAQDKANKSAAIKYFELAHELAWNTIKDFYEHQGEQNIQGSLDALRLAFNRGLLPDDALIAAIKSRNQTVHMYDEETMNTIYDKVASTYMAAFKTLEAALLQEKQQRGL